MQAIERTKRVPVIAMDYMCMNATTDDTNNLIRVIRDSCSECVWVVFTKKTGATLRP